MSHSAGCGCSHIHTSSSVTSVTSGVTSPCKAMLSTAVEEKQELRGLTDQLAGLMTRMRSTRQSPSTDPSFYQETIASLEVELDKVKNLYENELARLRERLDDTTSCRASTSAMYESSRVELNDLHGKVNAQALQIEQLQCELCCTKSELCKAKQTIADLTMSLQNARSELNNRPNNSQLEKDYEDIKRRIECEMKCRVEGEDMIKTLKEKLAFESRLHDQVKAEMDDRLRGANDTIRSLEQKLKEATSETFDYNGVLAKLREGTASELQRYKAETDEALNRNLQGLRMQIESEKTVRGGLTLEKERMEQLIAELRQRIADSEGQMAGLINQRDALEESLRNERSRAYNQIRELEVKLGQMNDVMLEKVKECTNAREAQVSLKTEIDAFRVLLKEGENRLNSTAPTIITKPDPPPCPGWSQRVSLDTDVYMVPRPPSGLSPRRRPTSAHASCYHSKTRVAPSDDRVFHSHTNMEHRSGAATGSCSLTKHRYLDTEDLDLGRSSSCGKRITVELQPECIKRVSFKDDDFEVSGKSISTCYAPSFPKNIYCNKRCVTRKRINRPKSSYYIY